MAIGVAAGESSTAIGVITTIALRHVITTRAGRRAQTKDKAASTTTEATTTAHGDADANTIAPVKA